MEELPMFIIAFIIHDFAQTAGNACKDRNIGFCIKYPGQRSSWIDLNKGVGAGCRKVGLFKLRRGVHPPNNIRVFTGGRPPIIGDGYHLKFGQGIGHYVVMPLGIAYYGVGIGKEHGLGWGRHMSLACKKMSPDP